MVIIQYKPITIIYIKLLSLSIYHTLSLLKYLNHTIPIILILISQNNSWLNPFKTPKEKSQTPSSTLMAEPNPVPLTPSQTLKMNLPTPVPIPTQRLLSTKLYPHDRSPLLRLSTVYSTHHASPLRHQTIKSTF